MRVVKYYTCYDVVPTYAEGVTNLTLPNLEWRAGKSTYPLELKYPWQCNDFILFSHTMRVNRPAHAKTSLPSPRLTLLRRLALWKTIWVTVEQRG